MASKAPVYKNKIIPRGINTRSINLILERAERMYHPCNVTCLLAQVWKPGDNTLIDCIDIDCKECICGNCGIKTLIEYSQSKEFLIGSL